MTDFFGMGFFLAIEDVPFFGAEVLAETDKVATFLVALLDLKFPTLRMILVGGATIAEEPFTP